MAALSGVVAAKYSPLSGLARTSGLGGAAGFALLQKPSFSSAPAITSGLGGAAGYGALNPPTATDTGTPGPAPSIGGVGAYTPDWASLIANDPGLLAAKNAAAAGGVQDIAGRNAAIQRALVNFGRVPDLASLAKSLGMSQADIQDAAGPDVQRLAQENTAAGTSTEARLGQANQDAIRSITNQLNARGILNSGETGFQLDRQNTSNRQGEYDANQKLLDYLNQYQQGYVTAEQDRQAQLAQQYSAAADRQYQANQGSAGATAQLDHVDSQGRAVYRGPDGRLYNADGSSYSAPQASAPAPPAAPAAPPPAPLTTSGAVVGGTRVNPLQLARAFGAGRGF